jgi:hypothetical protein
MSIHARTPWQAKTVFSLPRMPNPLYLVVINLETGVRNVRNSPEFRESRPELRRVPLRIRPMGTAGTAGEREVFVLAGFEKHSIRSECH